MNRMATWSAVICAASIVMASANGASAQGAMQQVLDLNRQAMDQYMNLELEQAQSLLERALSVAQRGNVSGAPLARTYLNLGVVAIGGFADNGRGLNYFVQALEADGGIQLDPLTSTPEIQTVFQLARSRVGSGGGTTGGGTTGGGTTDSGTGGGTTGGGATGGSSGNVPHMPVPEQLAQTAVPVYVEVPGSPAHVYLFYQAHGMREFRRVEMVAVAGGYGYEIPCSDVFQPSIEYYIVAFGNDGSPVGFAGTQTDPYSVPIVGSRSHPAPALPGRAPPQTCGDEECPPGMAGCASGGGGGGGMGSTCRMDGECASGLVCRDDLCVTDSSGGGGGGGGGDDGNMPRFFIHAGGTLGLGVASPGMRADSFPCTQADVEMGFCNAVNDPEVFIAATDGGECAATPGVEGQEYCVRLAQGGIVAHPAIRVAVGYYVLPFFGIAAWARFAPLSGQGTMSFLTIGARGELQVTPPAETGFHASVFAGGGAGQVQIQPPGNGQNAPFIISGLGNITVGGYAGYRIMRNFGFVGEIDFLFQVPTFLFDIDITLNLAVTF